MKPKSLSVSVYNRCIIDSLLPRLLALPSDLTFSSVSRIFVFKPKGPGIELSSGHSSYSQSLCANAN